MLGKCDKIKQFLSKTASDFLEKLKFNHSQKKTKSKKSVTDSRLSDEEKDKIDTYLENLSHYFFVKKINEYIYTFQIPYEKKVEIKERYQETEFKKKTLVDLGIRTIGRDKALSSILKKKLNDKIKMPIEKIKDSGYSALYHWLQEAIEILSTIDALNEVNRECEIDKNAFQKELRYQKQRFEELKERITKQGV
jgi:hypothetical protein